MKQIINAAIIKSKKNKDWIIFPKQLENLDEIDSILELLFKLA